MTVQTITVGPGSLSIGDDLALTTFESQVTSIRLTPDVKSEKPVPVLSGESVAGDRTESFTIEGEMFQDFGSTSSRTEWLFEHRGQEHPFVYVPSNQKGKKITGTLVVEAIDIGGDVQTKPTSKFKFDLVGAPEIETLD
ncbi:hypothetical protein M3686_04775 [Micrococcus luteus]|uniref:hypothetical protein n=1 Tax=Micrococcus luteus TaxID=1270 RepID=UPI0020404323|nr:hypothetical protein [Micrococcus luteus]MCM3577448.1 hypothetical protein [Micrococcus luteus]